MADITRNDPRFDTGVDLKDKTDVQQPKLYKVIIHNDNYTTMEFVVEIIREVFHKSAAESTKIMLEVHDKGAGIAGIFPYDMAITKIALVHDMARQREYPLRLSYEEA